MRTTFALWLLLGPGARGRRRVGRRLMGMAVPRVLAPP
jgi:hypothetical protein